MARARPDALVIGVDADAASMVEASRRAARPRGGLPNALFVVSSVEELPAELDRVADDVRIHFPWGSLLRGLVLGDPATLRPIARISRDRATLRAIWSLTAHERSTGLLGTDLSELPERLGSLGFRVEELGAASVGEIARTHSSWAKRLGVGRVRPATRLWARRR